MWWGVLWKVCWNLDLSMVAWNVVELTPNRLLWHMSERERGWQGWWRCREFVEYKYEGRYRGVVKGIWDYISQWILLVVRNSDIAIKEHFKNMSILWKEREIILCHFSTLVLHSFLFSIYISYDRYLKKVIVWSHVEDTTTRNWETKSNYEVSEIVSWFLCNLIQDKVEVNLHPPTSVYLIKISSKSQGHLVPMSFWFTFAYFFKIWWLYDVISGFYNNFVRTTYKSLSLFKIMYFSLGINIAI